VNRVCGSGMQAIDTAARNIAAGVAEVALAGGVESMSHAPVMMPPAVQEALDALRAATTEQERTAALEMLANAQAQPVSAMTCALSDAVVNMRMGDTAEVLARKFAIAREEQDAFALRSHQRASAAWQAGHFDEEVVALTDEAGSQHARDTGIRPDTSPQKLAALRPVFDAQGTVTAGNSSQITDGAAMLLLASEEAVKKFGLQPLARIRAATWAGLNPREMGLGPAFAIARLLREAPEVLPSLQAVDFFEINEAFAVQVLACLRALEDATFSREALGLADAAGGIPEERLNVDGGAIALGHPLGASGARIVLHLARVLRREGARTGLAALCIGGGQGGAMLLEEG